MINLATRLLKLFGLYRPEPIAITINIAREFSTIPHGITRNDSYDSAQDFFEDILEPAFLKHDRICVELDGVDGYSSSFLMASFGRLSKTYSAREVLRRVTLVSVDVVLCEEIRGYIRDEICHYHL